MNYEKEAIEKNYETVGPICWRESEMKMLGKASTVASWANSMIVVASKKSTFYSSMLYSISRDDIQ